MTKDNICILWSNIEEFELRERNNDSKNPILAKARSDARAEAQLKIFEHEVEKIENEKRFICICGNRFNFDDLLEHQKHCGVCNK